MANDQQDIYGLITQRLIVLEAAEIAKLDPKGSNYVEELNYVKSKYEIMNITSKHSLMMSLMSLYEGFNNAFVQSSNNRKNFLTNITTKTNVDMESEDCGKVILKGTPGYGDKKYPEWLEWDGCGMHIPDNAYVSLTTNAAWPTIFMKSKNEKDSKGNPVEINIYEHAWNANVRSTKPNAIQRLPNNEKEPSFDREFKLVKGENDLLPFRHIRYEVQSKLDEYDVVVEIPFYSPYMDVLTQVNFKESETKEDILLTACVCVPVFCV